MNVHENAFDAAMKLFSITRMYMAYLYLRVWKLIEWLMEKKDRNIN